MSRVPEGPAAAITVRQGPIQNLRRVIERRETIRYLVVSNLKAGHRDKALGHFWSLLDPLLSMAVYFLVFGIGFRQAAASPVNFVVYLSIGVVMWRFLGETLSQATQCIRGQRGIIHEVSFPKAILPISICLSRLYDLLWGLLVLLGILVVLGIEFSVHLIWTPLLVLLQLIFTMGLAFIVAYLGAFFADTGNVVAVATRLWFYASPIFYYARSEHGHTGIIPPEYVPLYMLNPVASLLDGYRDALLWGEMPHLGTLGYLAGASLATLLVGFALFSRGEGKFAKYV